MLTIKEPITLKTVRPMQGIRHDMTERMQANYGLMNLSIRKEELLHITSQPAEVYFADSENFQILTNINNRNQQEIRLDVINNLMNRILVAQTENFTYQDTVFISTILRKLGIRDEKTFMKQVFDIQNEHKETNRLLHKYEKNQEILEQLIQGEEKREKPDVKEQQMSAVQDRRYFIHDEIFRRLETGKIYQDMRSFSKSYSHESSQIFPSEMQVAEQTKAAQSFSLQKIKNEITGEVCPVYYLNNNRYEYLQEIKEDVTQELEEQMSAAILLNLAEQSYVLRQVQIEENSHYWYSIARSLFKTAENTWKRYEANLMERKQVTKNMVQVLELVNNARRLEGDIVSNIIEEYYNDLQQWKEENGLHQTALTQKNIQENRQQDVHFSSGSYSLTQEEFQLNYLNEKEEEIPNETMITVEQLQKQLETFSQRNFENYQKITQIEQQQKSIKDRKVNRRKAHIDALRALENPNEVLREYVTAEYIDPMLEVKEQIGTQIYELLSEETKDIYRQFLNQNYSSEETFLKYVMNQPQESEARKEVIQVLEKIEKQEEVFKTKREEIESAKQVQVFNHANTIEKVQRHLLLWWEVQDYTNRKLEENPYLQSRAEEIIRTLETKIKNLSTDIESEKKITNTQESVRNHLKTEMESESNSEDVIHRQTTEEMENRLTSWKEIQEGTQIVSKEIQDLQSREKEVIHTQEFRLNHLKTEIESESNFQDVIHRQTAEEIENNLTLWKEMQKGTQIVSEEVQDLQSKKEKVIHTQEIQFKHLKNELESERYLETAVNKETKEGVETQLTLWKEIKEEPQINTEQVEELENRTRDILHTKEIQYIELRENVEKQIKRKQEEMSVINVNAQKEVRRHQMQLVHKVEEQLMNEELLEEMRAQSQRMIKTQQVEEIHTQNDKVVHQVVQEMVNKVQMNRVDNIEELVQQSVKRQLNQLSDQVYTKLEKKLQTERKRRGYF